MAVFEVDMSSTDIINKGTMNDDEVVASDVPPRYLFFQLQFPYMMSIHIVHTCPDIMAS